MNQTKMRFKTRRSLEACLGNVSFNKQSNEQRAQRRTQYAGTRTARPSSKYERLAREKCLLKVRRDSEKSAAVTHRPDCDVRC